MRTVILERILRETGGTANLAARLGISKVAVNKWSVIPAKRAQAIAKITSVQLHEMRPDIWEPPNC